MSYVKIKRFRFFLFINKTSKQIKKNQNMYIYTRKSNYQYLKKSVPKFKPIQVTEIPSNKKKQTKKLFFDLQ